MGRYAYLAAATLDEGAIEKLYEQLEQKHRYVEHFIFDAISEMIDHDMNAPHADTILEGLYVPDADLVNDHPVSPKSLAEALRALADIWRNDPGIKRLYEILRYANAAGALTAQKRGVIPALPTASEVENFLQETP